MATSTIYKTTDVVYTKGFITGSSSATSTPLTHSITLRPGTWIVMMKTPAASGTGTCILNLDGLQDGDYTIGQGFVTWLNYGTISTVIKTTQTRSIQLVSGASASYSWLSSWLDRGGLAAIRVGD